MKRLSLVGRVTVLATAVAIGVGVMFVAALLAILSLRSAENQEKKSAAITVATLRVENLSVDVGSAVRGYALSRDQRFKDLYNVGSYSGAVGARRPRQGRGRRRRPITASGRRRAIRWIRTSPTTPVP